MMAIDMLYLDLYSPTMKQLKKQRQADLNLIELETVDQQNSQITNPYYNEPKSPTIIKVNAYEDARFGPDVSIDKFSPDGS
jgi:hypothetical protein